MISFNDLLELHKSPGELFLEHQRGLIRFDLEVAEESDR